MTFRVTRTRAKKSWKATLNLSEFIDGEWYNHSNEKIRDTQDEIINIIVMDSLTFKSCALIMQDQYGIFLQSDKEARMSVLANLLDLGVYDDMENISRNHLSDTNKRISQIKSEIDNNTAIILSGEQEILNGVAEYKILLEQEKTVLSDKASYILKHKELLSNLALIESTKKAILELENEKNSLEEKKHPLTVKLSKEPELANASEQYKAEKLYMQMMPLVF